MDIIEESEVTLKEIDFRVMLGKTILVREALVIPGVSKSSKELVPSSSLFDLLVHISALNSDFLIIAPRYKLDTVYKDIPEQLKYSKYSKIIDTKIRSNKVIIADSCDLDKLNQVLITHQPITLVTNVESVSSPDFVIVPGPETLNMLGYDPLFYPEKIHLLEEEIGFIIDMNTEDLYDFS